MRWPGSSSAQQTETQQPQTAQRVTPARTDDDEPDYSGHYDDAIDDLDDGGCGPAGGRGEAPGSSPASHLLHSSSNSDYPDDGSGGGGDQLPPAKAAASGSEASGAAAAIVIEDEEDDEGMDHALEDPPVPWRPQNQQSTCEFTHTIVNYSQKRESGCKKAEYSATTVDSHGNRWRLIVYVNGNGRASNHHLSLFLQVADADELPFGWKKAVSYVLTLEHPSGPSLGYAKRNPDKTFKLCPKAIDWGWSQFITSDRIQQEGYISNDSLTVRASVTVKSSSVSIDPEDAELYLKCAVEEGNADAVEACLTQGAGVNCQFKDDLYTPLHTACSSSTSEGSLEVLKLLLKRGADGNACNKWRETPLLIAANNGHRAAVDALLESGADPSLCSEAGWSALTFAAHKGYDDIVSLLLGAGAPVNCRVTEDLSTPLHKACAGGKSGHLSAVKQLLTGGADVHALNKWRETPLLTAANHGQASAVEALLRSNADPCKCTDTGWSPLSIAAYKGHDDVVRLLLEEGAPTEEADPTLSALLQAATKGLPETVELLLRHGADHTVTTKKGDTALSILVEQNLIDAAVEMVTDYNASVPRCSRDRKKVQRARLLINLRVKQQHKERLLKGDISDDDSDQDESDDESNSALHDSDCSPGAVAPGSNKKVKGKSKPLISFASAEAEARAAEEALLLELEQEESLAQRSAAAATSKRSKKKKKKERERQQKLLDEKVQQEKDLKVAEVHAKQRRLQEEEKERQRVQKEREVKEREHREKERAAAREEKAAAKRKEKEGKERRQRDQDKKERERKATSASATQVVGRAVSPVVGKKEKDKPSHKGKSGRKQQQTPQMEAVKVRRSSDTGSAPPAKASALISQAPAKKRGWETTPPGSATTPVAPASTSATSAIAVPQKTTPMTPATSNPQAQNRPASRPSTGPAPGPASGPAQTTASVSPSASAGPVRSSAPEPRGIVSHLPATAQQPQAAESSTSQPQGAATSSSSYQENATASSSVEDQLEDMATGVVDFLDFDSPPNGSAAPQHTSAEIGDGSVGVGAEPQPAPLQSEHVPQKDVYSPRTSLSNAEVQYAELPSVSLYRQEKLSELLRRCALARSTPSSPSEAMSVVDEETLRSVIYRWIVRSSHDASPVLDPIIPSWTDGDMLAAFFQRQLISESRRGVMGNSGAGMVSIEVLKEAGSTLAMLCQALAKDLSDFRQKCEQQVPPDWSDSTINVAANEVMSNDGHSTVILIDWAGRSQVCLVSHTFSQLRNRYHGMPSRLLTAIFAVAKRYETLKLVAAGSRMDYQLPPIVLNTLAGEVNASIELWTGPLSVFGNNAFCGMFPDVDAPFGGLKPFGKENGGGEVALVDHGGSVVVMPPLESSTAALYMRNILDALDLADGKGVPLSFTVFLPVECFTGNISAPTINNLPSLDPRLGDRHGVFVRFVETLPAGQHVFACGEEGMTDVSQLGSLFVLMQNEAGKLHFPVVEGSIRNILRSTTMGGVVPFPVSVAPDNVQGHNIVDGDYSNLGGEVIGNNYGGDPNRGGRRGRLFELVEDGEENANDVDVMSGMLGNLDASMFQNNTQDVDIEAISLMGIGGAANSTQGRTAGRFG